MGLGWMGLGWMGLGGQELRAPTISERSELLDPATLTGRLETGVLPARVTSATSHFST
jgi:hypothetical protein